MSRNGGSENWVELDEVILNDQSRRDDAAFVLITKGINAWNKAKNSRKYPFDNEDYSPNFDRRIFAELELTGWRFSGSARNTKFSNCHIENCNFEYSHFEGSKFENVIATDSIFIEAFFDNALARDCSFSSCNFDDISWLDGKIENVSFEESKFTEAELEGTFFYNVSFQGARGQMTNFNDARMFEINWLGAHFLESSFVNTYMSQLRNWRGKTSFVAQSREKGDSSEFEIEGADFSNTFFRDAELEGLDFAGSNLNRTTFLWCNLSGCNFRQARGVFAGAFRGADLAGAELPPEVSFDDVIKKIESAVALARPAYLTNLVTCAAVILAVVVASGARTITLPLFGVPIDSKSFAIYSLLQSAFISIYVGIYLIRIWEGAADLPVIHPNGISTPDLISPWTVIAPIWYYLKVQSSGKRLRLPKGYGWQFAMSILSHWMITPITAAIVALEFRFSSISTSLLCLGICILSLAINAWLYRAGIYVLKGRKFDSVSHLQLWQLVQ